MSFLLLFAAIVCVLILVRSGKPKKICRECGSIGSGRIKRSGSMGLAWLLFIFLSMGLGLIFYLFRALEKHEVCASCGHEGLIPLNSPIGRKLKNHFH